MTILTNVFRLVLFLLPVFSTAQTKITGSVMNKKMQPLSGANVLLLKSTDSSLVKGSGSAKDGSFSFENVKAGEYLVMATHVGFSSRYLPPISIDRMQTELNLKIIELAEEAAELQQVTVQSRRPLLE